MKKMLFTILSITATTLPLTGCWLAAGAAGAEGGYIASQDKRSAGQTVDDQLILASVKSKLLADPDVSGLNINVDVFKGHVTLKGYVKSTHEMQRAIDLARSTKGVMGVNSKLVLDS